VAGVMLIIRRSGRPTEEPELELREPESIAG